MLVSVVLPVLETMPVYSSREPWAVAPGGHVRVTRIPGRVTTGQLADDWADAVRARQMSLPVAVTKVATKQPELLAGTTNDPEYSID